jgi:hypothetical protein
MQKGDDIVTTIIGGTIALVFIFMLLTFIL